MPSVKGILIKNLISKFNASIIDLTAFCDTIRGRRNLNSVPFVNFLLLHNGCKIRQIFYFENSYITHTFFEPI